MRRIQRDDDGNIIVTVLVMFVVTGLVFALIALTDRGLQQSREAGESANALQLADAGVNDAIRQVSSALTTDPISLNKNLGNAGAYSVTAENISGSPVWRIDATGTDHAGMKRRIVADAEPEPLFANALFVQSSLAMASGATVDSYLDGTDKGSMCTGKGVVGTNSAAQMTPNNNGQGDTNCREWKGDVFPYSFDGCVSYAASDPDDFDPDVKCPPDPFTLKKTPEWRLPKVFLPPNQSTSPQPAAYADCSQPIPPGTYYWDAVSLPAGCSLQGNTGDAIIYTTGPITIGSPGSASTNYVNRPPDNTTVCPHDHTLQGQNHQLEDDWGEPPYHYCPNWARRLQIFAVTGTSGNVTLTNHLRFWGLISAPSRALVTGNNNNQGAPQVFVWGALVAQTANMNAQFTMHYDERLAGLVSSTYRVRNWREESLG